MRKEYSLKTLRKRSGPLKTDGNAIKIPVNLRINASVLSDIKTEAERQGVPYQTLIGSILHRYVLGDLIDRESTKNILKIVTG